MTAVPTGTQWPSVSGVIVTGPGDAFLRRAIRSVVSQPYPGRVECIVVFDRCPAFDLSDVAPADGGDRALRVIENRRTPGMAGARNAGVERAFGDVLAFCGADDEWLPDKISRQIAALEVTGGDVAVGGIERTVRHRRLDRVPTNDRLTLAAFLRARVAEVHPSTVTVRREALHTIGAFFEVSQGRHAEVCDWLLRAAGSADLVAVRIPLVRVDRSAEPSLGVRWQTIAGSIRTPGADHREPRTERWNVAHAFGRVAAGSRQRSESRRGRGIDRVALRAP